MISIFIFFLLLVSFSLGNIYKLSILTPELRISFLDFSVFVLWIVFLLKVRFKISRALFPKPILLFIAIALISLLISGSRFGLLPTLVGFSYLVRWSAYSLLFLPLSFLLTKTLHKKLIFTLILSTVTICLTQYLLFPDSRPLAQNNWDPHYFRVVGQFLDPGFTGLLLVFFLHLIVLHRPKIYFWLPTYIALALTYSRASYLAFIVSSLFLAIQIKSRKYFLFCLMILTLTIVILPRPGGEGVKLERTSSIEARLLNWSIALTIFSHQPILGVGFNVYRYAQLESGYLRNSWQESHSGAGIDSSLLFVAATTGIIGLAFYLNYLRSLIHINHPWLLALLIPLFVHSWFLNSLFYPPILFLLSLLISYLDLFPGRIARSVSGHKN